MGQLSLCSAFIDCWLKKKGQIDWSIIDFSEQASPLCNILLWMLYVLPPFCLCSVLWCWRLYLFRNLSRPLRNGGTVFLNSGDSLDLQRLANQTLTMPAKEFWVLMSYINSNDSFLQSVLEFPVEPRIPWSQTAEYKRLVPIRELSLWSFKWPLGHTSRSNKVNLKCSPPPE